jgi:hypothetical protein
MKTIPAFVPARATAVLLNLAVFLCFTASVPSFGAERPYRLDFDFPAPQLTRQDVYHRIEMEGLPSMNRPGDPLLPVRGFLFLLPPGEELAIAEVDASPGVSIPGSYRILPSPEPRPLSTPEYDANRTDRSSGTGYMPFENPAVYDREIEYPPELCRTGKPEWICGYQVVPVTLHPVYYIPSTGTVGYHQEMELCVTTRASEKATEHTARMFRSVSFDRMRVASMVINPGIISSYDRWFEKQDLHGRPGGRWASKDNLDEYYDYIIITDETLEEEFRRFADYKTSRTYNTGIFLKETIVQNYTGEDEQEKIREFIKDAYLNAGTTFFLLGGDDEILPHRGLYATVETYSDADIAADIYFAGLDGTWNDDHDSRWGEPEEADLLPEVYIGRAAVDSPQEAEHFIDKQIRYQETPVAAETATAVMAGEDLGWVAWGKDYKEEIRWGSDSWGFHTDGVPDRFTVHPYYDRDIRWTDDELIAQLNNGTHLVNHIGHSNVTYTMKMSNSDVTGKFTNDGIDHTFFIIYTQGCYCNSWDNRTSSHSYTSDCIAEQFTTIESGAVCFIGNTRYGWGSYYDTQGLSQYYDRQFFDALFGENITRIGMAEEDSKIDNIPYMDLLPLRWCHYQLCLLGDPSLDIWTDTPRSLKMVHTPVVLPSTTSLWILVTDQDGIPVHNARVAAHQKDGQFASGLTDNDGVAQLDFHADGEDTIRISALAHNFIPLESFARCSEGGSFLSFRNMCIDDDDGNGNGRVNPGETIELPVEIKNWGDVSAAGIQGVLTADTSYVRILEGERRFRDLAPGDSAWADTPYLIEISDECPDGEHLSFQLTLHDENDDEWTSSFWTVGRAPSLHFSSLEVDDIPSRFSGNGILEPGETAELHVEIVNHGSETGYGVQGVMANYGDPYIELIENTLSFQDVDPGERKKSLVPVVVSVLPECPDRHIPELGIELMTDEGYTFQDDADIIIMIPGFFEDVEGEIEDWVHYPIRQRFYDEWHPETWRNHTPGGCTSWKCGGEGALPYKNENGSCLVTPLIGLPERALLSFWYRIESEVNPFFPHQARDGAIVELSTDNGLVWSQIHPVTGYTHTLTGGGALPRGCPCFSGEFPWSEVFFDLSEYSGMVRLRFRFGSNIFITGEGWYIDDISVLDSSPYDAHLLPDNDVVYRGGDAGFSFTIDNVTDVPHRCELWAELFLPEGDPYSGNPVIKPVSVTIPARASLGRHFGISVPAGAPLGVYTFVASAGFYQDYEIVTDSFEIEVKER